LQYTTIPPPILRRKFVKQLEPKGVKAKAFQANLGNYENVRSKLDSIKNRAVDMKSDKLNIGSSTTC